ncbi:hypothetical protein [Streptomyces sviceus]|uniref:hypothetical protein n=1 Tax=Streptomyces sviceus TaxID=285530 RepID=UPI003324A783
MVIGEALLDPLDEALSPTVELTVSQVPRGHLPSRRRGLALDAGRRPGAGAAGVSVTSDRSPAALVLLSMTRVAVAAAVGEMSVVIDTALIEMNVVLVDMDVPLIEPDVALVVLDEVTDGEFIGEMDTSPIVVLETTLVELVDVVGLLEGDGPLKQHVRRGAGHEGAHGDRGGRVRDERLRERARDRARRVRGRDRNAQTLLASSAGAILLGRHLGWFSLYVGSLPLFGDPEKGRPVRRPFSGCLPRQPGVGV